MPFTTTWMDLEDIMLNEISQRKTNIVQSHLYIKSYTHKKDTENRMLVARGGD